MKNGKEGKGIEEEERGEKGMGGGEIKKEKFT